MDLRLIIRTILRRTSKSVLFWVILVLVLFVAILVDLIGIYIWMIREILSGKWNPYLLGAGFANALLESFLPYMEINRRRRFANLSRMLFLTVIIWTFAYHGILRALTFSALIFITSRLLKIIVKRVRRVETLKRVG